MSVPLRYLKAYQSIERLATADRYLGAFVFGSVARGDCSPSSDFDVKVVVAGDRNCASISHPIMEGVKLDISFASWAQTERFTRDEIARGQRVPMLAESIIVFDKTGDLGRLKAEAMMARPQALSSERLSWLQFMIYHANDKIERSLRVDPASALLTLHTSVSELLMFHYQIQLRWWVSSKRLLSDLDHWDAAMAKLLRTFVVENEPDAKFAVWSDMVTHVLKPVGGRLPIAENHCSCDTCRADLGTLHAPEIPVLLCRL